MTYQDWMDEHYKKHRKIIERLAHLNDDAIIEYFLYDNMVEKEVDFCLLYKDRKKCHDMENLNCYLCACPHFRFKEGETTKSTCSINSKFGAIFKHENDIHQDCSACIIPHKKSYIKKVFKRNWKLIMKDVHE